MVASESRLRTLIAAVCSYICWKKNAKSEWNVMGFWEAILTRAAIMPGEVSLCTADMSCLRGVQQWSSSSLCGRLMGDPECLRNSKGEVLMPLQWQNHTVGLCLDIFCPWILQFWSCCSFTEWCGLQLITGMSMPWHKPKTWHFA